MVFVLWLCSSYFSQTTPLRSSLFKMPPLQGTPSIRYPHYKVPPLQGPLYTRCPPTAITLSSPPPSLLSPWLLLKAFPSLTQLNSVRIHCSESQLLTDSSSLSQSFSAGKGLTAEAQGSLRDFQGHALTRH